MSKNLRNVLKGFITAAIFTTGVIYPINHVASYKFTLNQIKKAEKDGVEEIYCKNILENSSKIGNFFFGSDEAIVDYLYKK